jgi:hypothetical protein
MRKETIQTRLRLPKISKEIFFYALVLSVFILFPYPSLAGNKLKTIKIPETLSPGLLHLLNIVEPENEESLNLHLVEKVLDFVLSADCTTSLYYADKKFGATSAYYGFDIHESLEHILRLAYNPNIPSYAVAPSSVRLSHWTEIGGQNRPFPAIWKLLPELEQPIIIKGTEYIQNTPDLFTGAYYGYHLNRTLCLLKHKNRNILISLSKQTDISDVGKKGIVLGSDENWDYFYSGQKGLTKTGLGWVRSYMYDSASIVVYYEVGRDTPRVRCGIFKWLNAGWAEINMVKKNHIHRGLKRFGKTFKAIMEYPSLPKATELAKNFSRIEQLPLEGLRDRTKTYFRILEDRYTDDILILKKYLSELFTDDKYLSQMTREEMQSILVLEYMKSILGKNQQFDESYFRKLAYIRDLKEYK